MSPLPPRGAPHATTVRVGITLYPCVLLGDDVKNGARGWARATARDFLREFVAPADPSSFPKRRGMPKGGCARGQ